MTKAEFKERIKGLAFEVIKDRKKSEIAAVEYDELTKFPELKEIIISLLTTDFDPFLSSIDWVAPRPTTFRKCLIGFDTPNHLHSLDWLWNRKLPGCKRTGFNGFHKQSDTQGSSCMRTRTHKDWVA